MNALVWARVLPAVALLPIGGWPVRLLLGAGAALYLGALVPVATSVTVTLLVAEVALGALLGILASLPIHAAGALRGDGPPALGFAARIWAWALFFAIGGPILWLGALGQSFAAAPLGLWPGADGLTSAGADLFRSVLMLGLPAWLTALLVGPLSAWVDRVGGVPHGVALRAARPVLTLAVLVALLPLLLDVLRAAWLSAVGG